MRYTKLFLLIGVACANISANSFWTATVLTGTAAKPFADIATDYSKAAAGITKDIAEATTKTTSAMGAANGETVKAIYSASMKSSNDFSAIMSSKTKMEMDYQAELLSKEIRARNAPISANDTKEEVDFIIEYLARDDIKNQNSQDIISYAKANLDGKATVLVQSEMDKSDSCKGGKCGVETTIYPGMKMAMYAQMCAKNKRAAVNNEQETRSKSQTSIESAILASKLIENTNASEATAKRNREQQEIACTPVLKKVGKCAVKLSEEEYVRKMLNNEIIPNGNISSSNFYSPSPVGGAGYIDLSSPEKKDLAKHIEFESLERVNTGVQDLPQIVDTYRNSSQLLAAKSFADNIINADIVHNQSAQDRTKASSSEFQSMFLSRQATLSLARKSFDESISNRRGEKLSNIEKLDPKEIVKEREDGASKIDRMRHEIQLSLEKFDPKKMESIATASEKELVKEMLSEVIASNKMEFEELMALERQELLLATLLVREVNSPENIKYMESIGGR